MWYISRLLCSGEYLNFCSKGGALNVRGAQNICLTRLQH